MNTQKVMEEFAHQMTKMEDENMDLRKKLLCALAKIATLEIELEKKGGN